MIELLSDPAVWAAFATLTVMEIVLGIDNIVFISVLVARLPKEQADRARRLGLAYKVQPPHERTIKPKAYADNFRYDRVRG